jgi:proton-dependent oligopeptide transporter, POT family
MTTSTTPQKYLADGHAWHPPGLALLFGTEMMERLSYYGMRAILVLYLVDKTRGGLGWSSKDALALYGNYTGLVYLSPLLGGFLADNVIGQRKAIIIGGVLMTLGHLSLAFEGLSFFYAGLLLLILGNGLFKPNMSSMVGSLYRPGDGRRDGAYTIYYIGINVGAFLAPLICGTLAESDRFGWHWGFGAAGIGMAISLTMFVIFQNRLLGNVGLSPGATKAVTKQEREPFEKKHVQRMIVILVLCASSIFFWMSFEQAGGLMSLYTNAKVDRLVGTFEIPTSWFQALNAAFIVMFGPIFTLIWSALRKANREPTSGGKMGFGLVLVGVGFVFMMQAAQQSQSAGKASMWWVVLAYLFHTLGELCMSPVGLSMVSKYAHPRIVSLMMGIWFFCTGVANKLSGVVGGRAEEMGEYQVFFLLVVATVVAGVTLMLLAVPLKWMSHGAEQTQAAVTPEAASPLDNGKQPA